MGIINFLAKFGIFITDEILISVIAVVFPFLLVVCGYNVFVGALTKFNLGYQPIRKDGPKSHVKNKKNTYTLGGVLIFLAVFFPSYILYTDVKPIMLGLVVIYAAHMLLGGVDDYLKLKKKNTKGVSGRYKLLSQFIVSLLVLVFLKNSYPDDITTTLIVPLTETEIYLGYFYYIFAAIVIVGSSNAVNLTDGLDGLAASTLIPVLIFFVVIMPFNQINYLIIFGEEYLADLVAIKYLLYAVIGALLGFLWYNSNPAKIFMGDVGSLPLGALVGYMAVVTKSEILLLLVGGIFVVEALSVIIQVYYYKMTKKRVFKMAPIHHHFELCGMSESVIVSRCFTTGVIISLIGIALVFI